MKHTLHAFGKAPKSDAILDTAQDYAKRIERYAKFSWQWHRNISPEEALPMGRKGNTKLIALDEKGALWTTQDLASRLERYQLQSISQIDWVVGPADGFTDVHQLKPDAILSLSKMTLPHRFAMLLLLEQLYRAHSLLKGEPYHRV